METTDYTQDKDIVVNAANCGEFTALGNALKAADMVGTFKGRGPFTFFAPTDAAFGKLPRARLDALLEDRAQLTAVINGHVLEGQILAKDLQCGEERSLQGTALVLSSNDSGFSVNGARVARREIEASNGVIYAIDTVMMPAPL
jgi:uncharacterized surface protein with fasciclin (FAS1) repeats